MPRGSPKKIVTVRIDPALHDEVRRYATFTIAVEEGLALWLKQQERRKDDAPRPKRRERAVAA